jgi:hypothetical protein
MFDVRSLMFDLSKARQGAPNRIKLRTSNLKPSKNQSADSLISTYRDSLRNFQASFYLEVIPLNLPPHQSCDRRDGLIEK